MKTKRKPSIIHTSEVRQSYQMASNMAVTLADARQRIDPELCTLFTGDLIHDGMWLERWWRRVIDTPTGRGGIAYWALRKTGTSIGPDRSLVETIEYKVLFELSLYHNSKAWVFQIREM